jgi:N-methylhydantoinase A
MAFRGVNGDHPSMGTLRAGVDVGGTFTDLVALVDGRVVAAKVPTTPDDQSAGVMDALAASGLDPPAIGELRHGTTVATNALLERRGARTALVTNAGFRDVIEIGRQDRPSLYDLTRDRPPPLVPRELRLTVPGRMGPEGELAPLDEQALEAAVRRLAEANVEAVAVGFLFSYLHPEHEARAGERLRAALPGAHVALSSEVLPEFREYERFSTAVASAYLAPRLEAYLRRLAESLVALGAPEPLVMQSSGGVATSEDVARRAAGAVLSGPAGGAVGAADVARLAGFPDALTLDMGGTSADVALVRDGRVATTTKTDVGGVPIGLAAVDVQSVSAGGGSIAWVDSGGALRVGPESAGADPGPAAYGRGGSEPTVTDAHVVLGHLADGAALGGGIRLSRARAEEAVGRLADRLGLAASETASGIVRVADAEMARALRVVSVERGVDPRGLALVAFGGAGPMHACALAEELGIATVLVPRRSGVLSALGLALADRRSDRVAPAGGDTGAVFAALEAGLEGNALERSADLRYRGQGFELTVEANDPGRLAERFAEAHERRYGYRLDEPVELVALRVTARARDARPDWRDDPDGIDVEGPAVLDLGEATCVVAAGWRGRSGDRGTLVLRRT